MPFLQEHYRELPRVSNTTRSASYIHGFHLALLFPSLDILSRELLHFRANLLLERLIGNASLPSWSAPYTQSRSALTQLMSTRVDTDYMCLEDLYRFGPADLDDAVEKDRVEQTAKDGLDVVRRHRLRSSAHVLPRQALYH